MNVIRIGISGAGFGVSTHLPALVAHPRFEVVALASPSRAASVAKERGIPHAFPSARAMIDGCELDAVVIASPPFTHRDDVLAALDAGKHVMCEKPFALNVEEAEEMVAAARDAGTACGVAHEFRFVPERAALREMVENGHLEPLRELEITHLTSFLRKSGDRVRGWWFERERGGGIAGALMSHIIDSANWTLGRSPLAIHGLLRTANTERHDAMGSFTSSVDDGAFALLDYGAGVVARLAADGTSAVDSFTMALHAENRTAVASGTGLTDMRLFSIEGDSTDELDCKPSPYAKFQSINASVPLMMELYDEWIKEIETGRSAVPTFEDALATQRVLASIGYTIPS